MFAEFLPETAEARQRPIWRVRDMLYGVGLLILALAIVTASLGVFDLLVRTAGEPGTVAAAVSTIAFEGMFGGTVIVLARRRGLGAADLGFVRPSGWGPAVIAWIGTYLIIAAYQVLLLALDVAGIDVSAFDEGNPLPIDPRESATVLLLFGAAVVAVAPVAEELFFRALLFRGMRGYWRLGPALAMSGLAFGAFHINPGVIVPFAAIGALFAWANEQSGSLWTSITAHAAVNGVSFVLSLMVMEP